MDGNSTLAFESDHYELQNRPLGSETG